MSTQLASLVSSILLLYYLYPNTCSLRTKEWNRAKCTLHEEFRPLLVGLLVHVCHNESGIFASS